MRVKQAVGDSKMQKRIQLNPDYPEVYIDVYKCDGEKSGDAILVIPGGGYGRVCSDREGEPIANAFRERGVTAFVLSYRVAPNRYPSQLLDAASAMAYIKKNAIEFDINPERVFAVGFSAGGHLVGTLSTKHTLAEKLLSLPENFTRPRGSIYAYPVVSASCATHSYTLESLTGKPLSDFSPEEIAEHSVELNVTEDTPPAFIWHTVEDEIVPVIGSLRLAEAYIKTGVPVMAHIYPYGPHGVALANEVTKCGNDAWIQPLCCGWVDYAAEFIKTV